jgi:hypothetical protein
MTQSDRLVVKKEVISYTDLHGAVAERKGDIS